MGRIKIPYYTLIASRGYWRPTRKMRSLGFQIVRCGVDLIANRPMTAWMADRHKLSLVMTNLIQSTFVK
jgi:hypothetical protein